MKKTLAISSIFLFTLFFQGCYTQLAMFYPDPEIEINEEEQFYDTYNRAIPSLKAESYAQDGRASMPLSYSACLLYTSPSPRDVEESRMPSSA